MAITQTTLSAAIATTGATSITVRDALGFAVATDTDDVVLIGSEFLRVTAGMGTTSWTVTRGYASSTAATALDGATVTRIERGWTSLVDVKNMTDITDTADDTDLLMAIAAVNAELTQKVGVFLGPSTDSSRILDGRDMVGGLLWVPGGIRTATAMTIASATGGTQTTAATADWRLGPASWTLRTGQPYSYIEFLDVVAGSWSYFPRALRNVTVTGTFGYAAVPENAAAIARMVVMRMWADRNAGSLTNPSPNKFLRADDLATLQTLRLETSSFGYV